MSSVALGGSGSPDAVAMVTGVFDGATVGGRAGGWMLVGLQVHPARFQLPYWG